MSDIAPISGSVVDRADQASSVRRPEVSESRAPARAEDQVELSEMARYLSRLGQLPPVRQELVDNVRRQIDRNIYESEDRVDAAIDALLDDLDSGA